MMFKSVKGEHKDKLANFSQLIETNWGNWKQWYPDSQILAPNRATRSDYNHY
ncbi:MAG: hypothetical protein ACI9QN_002783, partial [Arcticibacterium sp.]